MQRLFSGFPGGAAGLGLLLLRATVGGALLGQGVLSLGRGAGDPWVAALAVVLVLDGLALVTGSLTPAASVLGTAIVTARLLAHAPAIDALGGLAAGAAEALLLVMAVAVGLLGPGAYSLDARLFGRREIEVPRHSSGRPTSMTTLAPVNVVARSPPISGCGEVCRFPNVAEWRAVAMKLEEVVMGRSMLWAVALSSAVAGAVGAEERGIKNVVLVHGGFVDGSGWEGVYRALKKDGYSVAVVQNPTISLADDVAVTRRVIAAQDGPVLLVGHSYGGAVITEAGNDPKVAALVYVAAFAPDAGESVSTLIKDPPPGAPVPPIVGPQDGFLALDRAAFAASFAADLPPTRRRSWPTRRSRGEWRRSRRHQPAGLEDQAELLPGRDRRPDDPSRRAAADVEARGRDGGRGQGEPLRLRVAAAGGRVADREGGEGREARVGTVGKGTMPWQAC